MKDLALNTVETTLQAYLEAIPDDCLEYEVINIEDALSRILYEDIFAKADLPPFDRAIVDGYAIKASDIAYATQTSPVSLKLAGEINIAAKERINLKSKETIKISKGDFLPINTNAVIPAEETKCIGNSVQFFQGVIPDSHVANQGEDLRANELFIRKKRKLRPQDIGGIIGIGHRQVKVYKKPDVTIIPTGAELVPIDVEPDEYQIIASNGYVLKGLIEQSGGNAKICNIVKDDLTKLKACISKAINESDMVLISGGSSHGSGDHTHKAIESFKNSKIISHGVSMRPGGHVLLAMVNNKPVIGLPGHTVSNMTTFYVFGKPVLRKLAGTPRSFWQERKDTIKLDAMLAKNVSSPEGKDDYVKVRLLEEEDGKIKAFPYTGKSSFLSTLVKSHGFIKIPADCTGLYEGDYVEVTIF